MTATASDASSRAATVGAASSRASGNVGIGKGTVVLEQAMKTTTPDGAAARAYTEGWTAYGSYKPPTTASAKKPSRLRPSSTMPVIQTSGGSGRPHLTDKSGDASKPDSGQKQTTDDSAKSPGDTTAKTSSDDDSRPTMKRRTGPPPPDVDDENSPPQDPNAASSQKPSDDDDRAERPTLKRRSNDEIAQDQKAKKKEKESASVTAVGSMSDDPDRPTLKHGTRHTEDEEMPKLMGVPADMKQMVAVSDAKNRDPHLFARPWEDIAERSAILSKMQAFARTKLTEYGVVQGIDPTILAAAAPAGAKPATPRSSTPPVTSAATSTSEGPAPPKLKRGIPTDDTTIGASAPAATAAKPSTTPAATDAAPPKLKRGVPAGASTTTTTSASKTTAPKTAASRTSTAKGKHPTLKGAQQVQFADEELKGYLLSYGGAPTYVYTARTVEPGAVTRYVTIVAQDNGMGQLKVAISSATDAAHLDRTPWMRLVDVVDVEASNRASLLFELRGQSSRQFALYRVIAAKPEQLFATSM
jgi:hypothetical protein